MYVFNLKFRGGRHAPSGQLDGSTISLDGSTISFNIEPLTPKDQALIFEQVRPRESRSQKPKNFNLKQLLSGAGFDLDKYNRLVILRAVKGWSGLRNKHLPILYDETMRGKWKLHGDGQDETEIPFSEDARRELSEMQSEYFMHWLDDALEVVRVMRKPTLMRSAREKLLAKAAGEIFEVTHG